MNSSCNGCSGFNDSAESTVNFETDTPKYAKTKRHYMWTQQ